jgi:hypothetical protein
MQCKSCGAPLEAGVVTCPSCGTPVSPDASDFVSYESSVDTVPYISYGPFMETSSLSSSQQSRPGPQPYARPQTYANPQFYIGVQPPPVASIQPLPNIAQQPLPVQPQRRNLPVVIAVLFIMLALLAGSGLTYYYVTKIARPAQLQTQATTATTQTLTSVQSTSTITATNPQNLYTQATSGTPALDTSMGSQNASDWLPGGNVRCTFSGTALHAIASRQASLCFDRSTSFDNFAYQAQATITQGDVSGLLFRFDAISQRAYYFLISSEGFYVLESAQGSSLSAGNYKILAGASSTAINSGLNQSNLLTIIARGSTIYLYVNKQYLTSVSDSTSSFGMIGVAGENTTKGPVDVAFSHIQVWKL